jgi:hypothetical protein
MGFDDRPTNGKSYACSGGFRRKERLEDTVFVCPIYSCAGVFNGDQDTGRLLNDIGPYPQLARSIDNGVHCLDRVHSQIQKHLLQLASICKQWWESLAQFS